MRPIWQICIPSARCNREISATEPNKVPQRIWPRDTPSPSTGTPNAISCTHNS